MKKNIIAFLLSVVLAAGSIGTAPALAAETAVQEETSGENLEETGSETALASEEDEEAEGDQLTEEASESETEQAAEEEEETETDEPIEEASEAETELAAEEELEEEMSGETEEADAGLTDEESSEGESARETEEESEQEDAESADEDEDADEQDEAAAVEEDADNEMDETAATADTEEAAISEEELLIEEGKEAKLAGDTVAFGTCGENATWTLTGTDTDMTLTISGSGAMDDFFVSSNHWESQRHIPWAPHRYDIKAVVVESGITSVGDYAFYSLNKLVNVSLADSVTELGYYCFSDCVSLKSITIPDSVTRIVEFAFQGCSGLTSITIPDSVTSVGWYAFDGCSSLKSVTIPDSVTSIEDSAFLWCTSLTSITIPDSVTSIEDSVFLGCTSLTSITIPDSVTSIGKYAFDGCSSLKSVTILDGVTSIGDCAFDGCSSLTSITIPDSVTSIEYRAFYNSELVIRFRGTKAQWDAAVGNSYLKYKSILYNCFSVPASVSLSGTVFTYNRKAINPNVTVTYRGKKLVEGTDYKVEYKNNVNVGKATVNINGIGEYSGTITKTFTIKKAVNKITAKNFVLGYSVKTRSFALGAKISNGTPKYASNSKSVTVSAKGVVTVKPKYIGKATITITAPEYNNFSKTTKKITITVKPPRTALKSISSSSPGKMTVNWVTSPVVDSYHIQYSTSSSFATVKSVWITKNSIKARTITGLTKGKKYYVRIRTIKTVSGVKYYSGWSDVKAVTIKK